MCPNCRGFTTFLLLFQGFSEIFSKEQSVQAHFNCLPPFMEDWLVHFDAPSAVALATFPIRKKELPFHKWLTIYFTTAPPLFLTTIRTNFEQTLTHLFTSHISRHPIQYNQPVKHPEASKIPAAHTRYTWYPSYPSGNLSQRLFPQHP